MWETQWEDLAAASSPATAAAPDAASPLLRPTPSVPRKQRQNRQRRLHPRCEAAPLLSFSDPVKNTHLAFFATPGSDAGMYYLVNEVARPAFFRVEASAFAKGPRVSFPELGTAATVSWEASPEVLATLARLADSRHVSHNIPPDGRLDRSSCTASSAAAAAARAAAKKLRRHAGGRTSARSVGSVSSTPSSPSCGYSASGSGGGGAGPAMWCSGGAWDAQQQAQQHQMHLSPSSAVVSGRMLRSVSEVSLSSHEEVEVFRHNPYGTSSTREYYDYERREFDCYQYDDVRSEGSSSVAMSHSLVPLDSSCDMSCAYPL